MNKLRNTLIAAASALVLAGTAGAQSDKDSRAEMNRGVPGVDVDVGRNANNGVIDIKRDNTEAARGVPGVDVDVGRNARGAVDVDVGSNAGNDQRAAGTGTRAPRSDRN